MSFRLYKNRIYPCLLEVFLQLFPLLQQKEWNGKVVMVMEFFLDGGMCDRGILVFAVDVVFC